MTREEMKLDTAFRKNSELQVFNFTTTYNPIVAIKHLELSNIVFRVNHQHNRRKYDFIVASDKARQCCKQRLPFINPLIYSVRLLVITRYLKLIELF